MRRRRSTIISISAIIVATVCIFSGLGLLLFQFLNVKEAGVFQKTNTDVSGRVLFISSSNPTYANTRRQLDGIETVFMNKKILLDSEYMDMKNFSNQSNYKNFYQSLKYKLSVSPAYDVVIASDDAALTFVREFHNELFPETPVVFVGVNDIESAEEAVKNPWITGSVELLYIEDTLEIAIEQCPSIEKVVALFDSTESGEGDKKQFFNAVNSYPNLIYEGYSITDYNLDDFARLLQSFDANTAILCMSSLQNYARTNSIAVGDLVRFIDENTPDVPVYRTNTAGLGYGFVGGKITDYRKTGIIAADTVLDILKGVPVQSLSLISDIEGFFYFDYKELKHFGFNPGILPSKATILNQPNNFIKKYRGVFLPFALICFALIALVATSVIAYRNEKKSSGVMMLMNKKMRQTNKELIDSKTRLTFIANNDALTKLPNRAFAMEEISKIIASGVPFSLFLMDIDDFKSYNDTFTHSCGDFVLKEFGKRLSLLAQNGKYFVARYGGDEFIIVYKNGHINRNGDDLEEMRKALNEPVFYNDSKLDITATLGFVDTTSEMTYDDMVSSADIAMYEAKKMGKGAIIAFSPEMKESILKRNRIIEILKEECGKGGFEIRYQPQVNAQTGDVYGFEALVRLQDYQVGPGEFIPVAEDGGFIAQIGRIVTEKVIMQMDKWRNEGMELKKVAINYSNGQLVDDEYVPFLESLMVKYSIPPEFVEIEITESLFMGNTERARKLFSDLSDIGVGLALDDFGTGYSSLSYLTFLPAKKVKIDKTLVDNYLVEGKESFILNIVHLVHDLGMKLTVEGVEQKWQFDMLREMNCDYIQGYFFSKPMQAEAVPQFTAVV